MSPEPSQIKSGRIKTGLTQKQAGELVRVHYRTWQKWERGTNKMPEGLWELFIIKSSRILLQDKPP